MIKDKAIVQRLLSSFMYGVNTVPVQEIHSLVVLTADRNSLVQVEARINGAYIRFTTSAMIADQLSSPRLKALTLGWYGSNFFLLGVSHGNDVERREYFLTSGQLLLIAFLKSISSLPKVLLLSLAFCILLAYIAGTSEWHWSWLGISLTLVLGRQIWVPFYRFFIRVKGFSAIE